jgi:hypothetical protein
MRDYSNTGSRTQSSHFIDLICKASARVSVHRARIPIVPQGKYQSFENVPRYISGFDIELV